MKWNDRHNRPHRFATVIFKSMQLRARCGYLARSMNFQCLRLADKLVFIQQLKSMQMNAFYIGWFINPLSDAASARSIDGSRRSAARRQHMSTCAGNGGGHTSNSVTQGGTFHKHSSREMYWNQRRSTCGSINVENIPYRARAINII